MAVTAAMVKELREVSGVGMVECKNALVEADGNLEKAIEILREKGMAAAVKKAGRVATEGLCCALIKEDGSKAVVVEVNSETDFVAKNQEFRSFVDNVAKQALNSEATNNEELLAQKWVDDSGMTVKDALTQKISVIGENLSIRRFQRFVGESDSVFVSYIHGAGKVVVLLELACESATDGILEAGKNICMQIAAMSPRFVRRSEVSEEFIEKEKEILTQQALNEGKPANIVEKMIVGRLNKELKEFCLLDQEYVREDKMTVAQYLESVGKESGLKLDIKRFVRFETGEGLEKKEENFAEEVSKAMQ